MGRQAKQKAHRKTGRSQQPPAGNLTPSIPSSASSSSNPLPEPQHVHIPTVQNPNAAIDDLTENQLKDLLFKNLDLIYNTAIEDLVALGCRPPLAVKTLLLDCHFLAPNHRSLDPLLKIHRHCVPPDSGPFPDLRSLQEHSLSAAVSDLLRRRPEPSRHEALCILAASDLSTDSVSSFSLPRSGDGLQWLRSEAKKPAATVELHLVFRLAVCYDLALIELQSLGHNKSLANKSILANGHVYGSTFNSVVNVVDGAVAFINSCPRHRATYSSCSDYGSLANHDLSFLADAIQVFRPKLCQDEIFRCLLMADLHLPLACCLSVNNDDGEHDDDLDRLQSMSPKEFSDLIFSSVLISRICFLVQKIEDGKQWAMEKAIQAARKLSDNLVGVVPPRTEMTLRTRLDEDRVEVDEAMKRIEEVMIRIKEKSDYLDITEGAEKLVNRQAEKLKKMNAEMRADLEAEKLKALELEAASVGAAKREKMYQKQLLLKEKQEEELSKVRKEIKYVQQELDDVNEYQKAIEEKLRQEEQARKVAFAVLEEERRAKEAANASFKRKHETLQQGIELNSMHHEDHISTLKRELFCLRVLFWTCVMCIKYDASVLFLPCAHQILCPYCNYLHEDLAKDVCPVCSVKIEQRIEVQR